MTKRDEQASEYAEESGSLDGYHPMVRDFILGQGCFSQENEAEMHRRVGRKLGERVAKAMTDAVLEEFGMIPKSVSASSAVEPENRGDHIDTNHDAPPGARVSDRQCASPADTGANTELSRAGQFAPSEAPQPPKCTERESVTKRRPPEPRGGENVTGLRTELVTLEVTHRFADPIDSVLLQALDSVLSGQGESVFVMDGSCEITKLTAERDTAIRERDEAKQRHLRECAKCSALADKVIALRARVADLESQLESVACRAATAENRVDELESAAKLAPPANADDESNHAPAASGVTVKEVAK